MAMRMSASGFGVDVAIQKSLNLARIRSLHPAYGRDVAPRDLYQIDPVLLARLAERRCHQT